MHRALGPIEWGSFINWINERGGESKTIAITIARQFLKNADWRRFPIMIRKR